MEKERGRGRGRGAGGRWGNRESGKKLKGGIGRGKASLSAVILFFSFKRTFRTLNWHNFSNHFML